MQFCLKKLLFPYYFKEWWGSPALRSLWWKRYNSNKTIYWQGLYGCTSSVNEWQYIFQAKFFIVYGKQADSFHILIKSFSWNPLQEHNIFFCPNYESRFTPILPGTSVRLTDSILWNVFETYFGKFDYLLTPIIPTPKWCCHRPERSYTSFPADY